MAPRTSRITDRVLPLASVLALAGCLSEVHVARPEDQGEDGRQFGNAPTPDSGEAGSGASGTETGAVGRPMTGPTTTVPEMTLPMGDLVPTNPPATCGGGTPVASTRCAAESTEVMSGLSDVYSLSVTSQDLYAATWGGVFRVAREGGEQELLVDDFMTLVLADEERFFFSPSGSELFVQVDDGERSVFLPTHGSIDGVSQDDEAIFAITDGFLFRVSKETQQAVPLVDGTNAGASLHWSGTAVDDHNVYFIGAGDTLSLERIGKDGLARTRLAANIGGLMDTTQLLVDAAHVYLAGVAGGLARVTIQGGVPETIARMGDPLLADPIVAQDDECLYYAGGDTLYCMRKAECTTEVVHTLEQGRISALAKRGDDLYFGVYVDAPAVDPQGWVGALRCAGE